MNPFLQIFIVLIALIAVIWLSGEYSKYIDSGREDDDDLDLFH